MNTLVFFSRQNSMFVIVSWERSLFSVTNTLQAVPTVLAAWNRRRWERRAVPTENLDPATLTLLVRSPT
jgi:hypothetical protein